MSFYGKYITGTVCLAAVVVSGSVYAAKADIEVRLQESAAKGDAGAGKILYTITNNSGVPLHVLDWMTPLKEVTGDLFSVSIGGKEVPYLGKLVKRKAPTAKEYIALKPNESLTAEVDLSAYYEMYRAGQYVVKYKRDIGTLVREAADAAAAKANGVAAAPITLDTSAIPLSVKGGPAPAANPGLMNAITAVNGSNTFVSCSNAQQTALINARNNANNLATNAKNYILAGTPGDRYTWWFGAPNNARYTAVANGYIKTEYALTEESYTFNCGCTDRPTFYAYVFPHLPYTVYLCGAFWPAPDTGTDSKAGTLVHESTHFNVIAGTGDYAYGQSAAHSLALSDPDTAVKNGDSMEYFAENTPARN